MADRTSKNHPWLPCMIGCGTLIALACCGLGTCIGWDPRPYIGEPRTSNLVKPKVSRKVAGLQQAATSTNGKVLVARRLQSVDLLDPISLQTIRSWNGPSGNLRDILVSGGGTRICVFTADGWVTVLDTAKMRPVAKFKPALFFPPYKDRPPLDISFDGSKVATFTSESMLEEIDIATRKTVWRHEIEGSYHGDLVSYSPDGKCLVANASLGNARKGRSGIVRLPSGRIESLNLDKRLSFSANSRWMVFSDNYSPTTTVVGLGGSSTIIQSTHHVWANSVSDDGSLLTSGNGEAPTFGLGASGRNDVFDPKGKLICWLDHDTALRNEICWWHGQPMAGGGAGSLTLYEKSSGTQKAALIGHTSEIKQVLVLGDDLLSLDVTGNLMRWQWPLGNRLQQGDG